MGRAGKVLIVDDSEPVARALARVLTRHTEVVVATGCDHAMHIVDTHLDLSAIISDFDLGEVRDGLWLLAQAQQLRPNARRILISGSCIPSLHTLDRDGAVDRFLPKPVDFHALLSALESPRANEEQPARSRPRPRTR